jgi:tellurite resistance protein TerC
MSAPTFLAATFLGTPAWLWFVFLAIVLVLLALDLGLLTRRAQTMGVKQSLKLSVFYIAISVAFGGWIWHDMGREAGITFFTAYFIEKSLSLDNIFVISLIFAQFATPPKLQHRALVWGILGVVVLRGLLIGLGTAVVAQAHWVLLLFGAFLIFTGAKMLYASDDTHDVEDSALLRLLRKRLRITEAYVGDRFFVRRPDPARPSRTLFFATPLFVALVLVEAADLVFAVDSVPAVLAITADPFLVYTSNIFAILGLRALYFALAATIERFTYLKVSLALILVFVGGKIFWAELVSKPDPLLSLVVVAVVFAGGALVSVLRPPRRTS